MAINAAKILRKMMGWCPVANTRISKLASGEDYAYMPEGGDASLRVPKSNFLSSASFRRIPVAMNLRSRYQTRNLLLSMLLRESKEGLQCQF